MDLGHLIEISDKISRRLAVLGGWGLLILSGLVGLDVIARKLFNISLQGSDEIGGYVCAIICAMGFAYALTERSHIRLNILLARFPPFFRSVLNALAYIILMIFSYILLWRSAAVWLESIQLKAVAPTPLGTPLVIPQTLWVLGLFWFSIHATLYCFSMSYLIASGKTSEINMAFGYGAGGE